MKIELLLDGNRVEINKDIDFVLNKQFTELQDLTSIIVDFSKTISVPMTAHNNELFNNIYKFEHQVLVGQNTINYDPSQKIPMQLLYNSSLVMEGYAVLVSCNLKNKTYDINLYGELGKIFSDLKSKNLNNYTRRSNGFWKKMTMNISDIKKSFTRYNRTIDWNSTEWSDFFGFAPQLYGSTDILDTQTFEVCQNSELMKFEDIINQRRNITYGGVYVGDGFDFNQYGELRTYMTRPYVYSSSIIQLIKSEIEENSEYTLELDESWFGTGNPYFTHLCYFPGQESIIDKGQSISDNLTWNNTERTINFPMDFVPATESVEMEDYNYNVSGTLITITKKDGTDVDNGIAINFDGTTLKEVIKGTSIHSRSPFFCYNTMDLSMPVLYFGIYDEQNNLLYKLYMCDDEFYVGQGEGPNYYGYYKEKKKNIWQKIKKNAPNIIVPSSINVEESINSSTDESSLGYTFYFGNVVLNTNKFRLRIGCDLVNSVTGDYVKQNISMTEAPKLDVYGFTSGGRAGGGYFANWYSSISSRTKTFTPPSSMELTSNTHRSGSKWDILDILGNEFNPFNWFMDYVKMFRLYFDIDYIEKKIILSSHFFDEVTYNKIEVDYSKEVKVEPIVDNHSEIMFGYAENDSIKNTKYIKDYGVSYGDMSIITGMKINNDVMKLNPNVDNGVFIPTIPKALNWPNLSGYWPIALQTLPNISMDNIILTDKIINTLDKDGKNQYFPFFTFRVQNKYDGGNSFYGLSDDTPLMKRTGNYTLLDGRGKGISGITKDWFEQGYAERMTTIPQFDNYISMEIDVLDSPVVPRRAPELPEISEIENEFDKEYVYNLSYTDMVAEMPTIKDYSFVNPITGQLVVVSKGEFTTNDDNFTPDIAYAPSTPPEDVGDLRYQTFLFWSTFVVPKEVYNGEVPNNIESFAIYNRWKNYLNELFNINNKKVTCYVKMSYQEFINFKFNKLLVIDGSTFLVNKIIDFDPDNADSTKVELIQITNPENLR